MALAVSPFARAEAVIAGRVEAKEECAHAPMEAWLSSGTKLLYQVEVPQHGSFEFHVNSGKYDLAVVGATGCLAEAEVEARENDTRRFTVSPSPGAKPPEPEKHAALDWTAPSGGVTVDPVLYVNGPDGTEVKIRARLADTTHWLVAVPEHGEKAWSGTISKNAFHTSEDATYRYLFYDYRADQRNFQDSRGFCVGRGELLSRLGDTLKASGFKKNEIEDFSNFWRFKIPQSDRYCVYPQSSAQLEPSVRLEISPKPAPFTQLLLIVQIGENLDGKGKFRRAPVASWEPDAPKSREPAATPAQAGIEAREWGVGFLEGIHHD